MADPVRYLAPANARVALSEVRISDLEVMADIGVFAHEKGRPQMLRLQVTLTIRPPAADRLEETIDYAAIAAAARALGKTRINLIETFARRLGEIALLHRQVEAVDILVEKPGAIEGGMAGARIMLCRA